MICPRCAAAIADHRMFCGDCGTPLPWRCRACGSENPAGKRFCGDCGAEFAAIPAAPRGAAAAQMPERRVLTVMFVDLVGSTAMGTRFDPEDLREIVATVQRCVTGLVVRFGGFVARYMGDGALVYFGYPHADEADAECAIRAGLTIVDAVAQLDTVAGPPGTLGVRIGIDSGLVVVGDLIGFGSSLETAVVGDTPNFAARLQTAAEPGMILISDATRRLVGGLFEYREIDLANLKGRRKPERGWAVLGESVIDSRYEALRPSQLTLVNRTEELDLLLRRWEQAKGGEGRVVLLAGEPGIGKSRLIAAVEQIVGTGQSQRLRFLCSPHHLDTPLHPIIRQLERAAQFQRGDSPAVKWDKIARVLPPGASSQDISLLADLLSIPCFAPEPLMALAPQRRKAMTFDVIVRQIDNLGRHKPILAILEDIHWADPTTLELLDLLVEAIRQLPALLVVTARPEMRAAWATRPHVTVQLLGGLDSRLAATLIKQVAGGRELPSAVIDRIITHADSVPLFIEELTKTVLQKGQADETDRQPAPLESLSVDLVPTSLHSSLMARLDRLPVGKEIAQIGSVIGREFSFEMMQTLSRLPARRLERELAGLAQAGIILPHGQPPSATYTFKHALVQDAAYASLLRDRRRAIHLQLAEDLEKEATGEDTEPQVIGWHFAEAGLPDKSVDYYEKAAERATGRFALAEMASHLRNGLRQVVHLPDSAERQRRELALQLALGRALIDHEGSGSESVRATFERAHDLSSALDDVELLPRVYDGLVLNYYFTRSQPDKIVQYTDEMTAVHRRTGDSQALLMTRRAGCLANLLTGRFEAARDEMQDIVDMYEAGRDGPQFGMSTRDPKVSTCTLLGICLTILGYPDAGAAMSLAGVQYAETLNHAISLNLGLRRACVQGMLHRHTQRVTELSSQLAALRAAYETYKGSWEGTLFNDWAELHNDPKPGLLERMQAVVHQLDATRNWALLPFYLTSLAELTGQHGDVAAAGALLERAAEISNTTHSRWCDAEMMRLKARFGARDAAESIALLHAGLATARDQRAKLWELRAASGLAEVLCDQGDPAAARNVLMPVYSWFREGRDAADLVNARVLLERIDQRGN
jgi:class 3 adenylate cyclase